MSISNKLPRGLDALEELGRLVEAGGPADREDERMMNRLAIRVTMDEAQSTKDWWSNMWEAAAFRQDHMLERIGILKAWWKRR